HGEALDLDLDEAPHARLAQRLRRDRGDGEADLDEPRDARRLGRRPRRDRRRRRSRRLRSERGRREGGGEGERAAMERWEEAAERARRSAAAARTLPCTRHPGTCPNTPLREAPP